MKKIVSAAAALLLTGCLSLSLCAVPASRLESASAAGTNMPEADYHVLKTEAAPGIDGTFDGEEIWGSPIIDVTGEDAYWYTVKQEEFQAKYPCWAKTGINHWEKTDGSVEFMRKIRVRVYSRWDDERLYFAFVVEGNIGHDKDGNPVFYDNYDAQWFANNVEITLGPENHKLNYSPHAADPDFDNVYEEGYTGNEYLFAITDAEAGKSVGKVSLGRYEDDRAGAEMWVSEDVGSEIAARNDPNVATGLQVYEMALPFELTHCSVAQGLPEDKGGQGGIPFTCAVNAQCGDSYSQNSLQGFQIGCGLFYRNPPAIFDSTKLILEETPWVCPGHTGGEHLKNCSAQAKCTICDERYGDFGDHYYLDGACAYCGQCENHTWNDESVWPTEGKSCTVCGEKFVCEEHTWNDESEWDKDGYKTCLVCLAKGPAGSEVLIGDLSGDGKVSSSDAVILARYLAKWDVSKDIEKLGGQEIFMAAANINQDEKGDVNSSDAVTLSRFLAKWNNTGFSDDIIVRVQ